MPFHFGHDTARFIPTLRLTHKRFVNHLWLERWTPHRPGGEIFNILMQEVVAFETARIIKSFFFEKLINIRVGNAASPRKKRSSVFSRYRLRLQNRSPVICAMNIPMSQQGSFQTAVLVKTKQRMVTRPAKVPVIGRSFLLTVSRTFRTLHIQNQLFHGNTINGKYEIKIPGRGNTKSLKIS